MLFVHFFVREKLRMKHYARRTPIIYIPRSSFNAINLQKCYLHNKNRLQFQSARMLWDAVVWAFVMCITSKSWTTRKCHILNIICINNLFSFYIIYLKNILIPIYVYKKKTGNTPIFEYNTYWIINIYSCAFFILGILRSTCKFVCLFLRLSTHSDNGMSTLYINIRDEIYFYTPVKSKICIERKCRAIQNTTQMYSALVGFIYADKCWYAISLRCVYAQYNTKYWFELL